MALSDKQLYNLCKKYGRRARLWRQKFAGLLPEVFKRRLYEKKGYGSIFEFAAKLAGMNQDQVRLVLNLERRFEDRPILKMCLESGEVSVNKLTRVASIATPEDEEFWAEQAKLLTNRALETLIKDEKHIDIPVAEVLDRPQNDSQGLHVQAHDGVGNVLQLNPEVEQKLIKLQNKGIDINALLLEFLKQRELEIDLEKENISAQTHPTDSRYIPVTVRNVIKKEFGTKCSVEWCYRDATEIHHAQRFSLSRRHDPKYLAPFCEEHHAIAHSIDQKYADRKMGPRLAGDP